MIDLTPLDVRNKRGDFKKIMRGYDPHEVDVFLEIAADRLETLVRENLQLRERTQTLQNQVDAQVGREQAVQDALVTAQALRADIQSQSQREAEHILREAESEARRVVAEAEVEARGLVTEAEAEVRSRMRGLERQLDHARDSIQELERRRVRFVKEFRNLLEREMDVVQVEEGRVPYEERAIELDLGGRSRDAHAKGGSASVAASGTAAAVIPAAALDPASQGSSAGSEAPDETGTDEPGAEEPESTNPPAPPAVGQLSGEDPLPLDALAPEVVDERVAPAPAEVAPMPAEPAPADANVAEAAAPAEPAPAAPAASLSPEAESGLPARAAGPAPEAPSTKPTRPTAPPAAVGDQPSSLELELMAGAGEEGRQGDRDRFADIPDLETLLAESGEELKPATPKDIAPPPAPGVPQDNLILFNPNEPDRGS